MDTIRLTVNLPDQIFVRETNVIRIVAESLEGSFGILPHRRDCMTALTPGIMVYEIAGKGEQYLAVDEGVLIKTGLDVTVAVRSAVGGHDLHILRSQVEETFVSQGEQAQSVRFVLEKIEDDFIRMMSELQNE